ncbi:TPA: ATP-binding cassette domain-containing protein [Pluralibacter gergoviae]
MMLLVVDRLSTGYPGRQVLNDVSFTLEQGAVCCQLGANGSEKTTLLRTLLGLLPPLGGEILPEGRSLFTMAPRDRLHPDHLAEMYGVAPEQIRHHLGNLRC